MKFYDVRPTTLGSFSIELTPKVVLYFNTWSAQTSHPDIKYPHLSGPNRQRSS